MKISVIVTVHDVPKNLLSACLESLAQQTLRAEDYEIIVVDDCSTNIDTIKRVDEFVEQTPNMTMVRHLEQLGPNEARWSGVKNACGDYVIFIDGDDFIIRDGLELLRREAAKADADIVTAPMVRWHPLTKTYNIVPITEHPLPNKYIERLQFVLSAKSSWTMCGRLFRRQVLTEEIFDVPIGQVHEDIATIVRIIFKTKTSAHCSIPIYFYTINFSSITTKFTEKHPAGIIYGVRDWIMNAKSRGLFGELAEAIGQGAEKLVNVCVIERCFFSENLTDLKKMKVLRKFREEFFNLPLHYFKPQLPSVRFLYEAESKVFYRRPAALMKGLGKLFPPTAPSQIKPDQILKYGVGPTEMAQRLKDKIVIIAQVDYQVRNAAAFARELTLRGHTCVVLDNSGFVARGKRRFPENEHHIFYRTEHIKVKAGPYPVDWLSTAKLVVTFNDFNEDFREALEFRHRLCLPSVCAVEGINDFLRADFEGYPILPYRRCGYVFLAGEHDQKYFTDRTTYVSGLPIIEALSKKAVTFPPEPLAVLNVNFTYGVLEDEREGFVQKAKDAFEAAGWRWAITQHPMDKGKFDDLPVSNKSQYQLIADCTVFVSRFATGILEALASGKPAIYFNPHEEKVDKFKEPHGAYEIATTELELVQALRNVLNDISMGVDFRERAQEFLRLHTGWDPAGPTVGAQFAAAATEIIDSCASEQCEASELFFEVAARRGLFDVGSSEDTLIVGEFNRRHRAQLNEEELIGRYFGKRGKLMIDVGANLGDSLEIYLGKGWEVHAFEPDPNNRRVLLDNWANFERLTVNRSAVSNEVAAKRAFYASDESTGISGLSPFTDRHREIAQVETITLKEYYERKGLGHVDFLKIDVEGFEKFVLNGVPWDVDKPEVVLAEFEDAKTVPLGYTVHDLASLLIEQGYSVYVSEWLPIIRYGVAHDWRRMLRYSSGLELNRTWGNVIAFYEKPVDEDIERLVKQTLKFAAKPKSAGVTAPDDLIGESDDAILSLALELDRLWVLSIIQGCKSRQSLFSLKKIPDVDARTPLLDLVHIARRFGIAIASPKSFDEARYLLANPDVAEAVDNGAFASGYEHFVLHGHSEAGRGRPTV